MIGYKACLDPNFLWRVVVVELDICGDTNCEREHVVNDMYAKFRTNKARVLRFLDPETGKELTDVKVVRSVHQSTFKYKVGSVVCVRNWNSNIDEICTTGIHFFKSFDAARLYLSLYVRWKFYFNQ